MNLGELFQGPVVLEASLENAVVRMALVLMHSLWQVLLVVNVVAILLAALSRATPSVRYTVALAGLLILPVFPLVTWFVVEPARQAESALATASTLETQANFLRSTTSVSETAFDKVTRFAGGIDRYCRAHASWLAAAWSVGVAAFALRIFVAWLSVWKLRSASSEEVPYSVNETLHGLLKVLGMSSSIQLSVTDKVDGPAVVGWFRPLILLPAHLVTGLNTDDLTHILAHELAHIRRGDYAVNVVQCVIEMLFFHHPAVWWLSHQVREEREHCCDEIAIAACGDRFAYARSLATLDDMRPEPRPLVLALGSRGGRLMNRIRRLLGVPTPSIGGSGAIVLTGMALAVVIALAMGVSDATAQTEEKSGQAKTGQEATDPEARKLYELELDDVNELMLLAADEQIVKGEQAREQARRAEQLATVTADLDKAVAELTLREQKFKIAELELVLEEARAMESFADEEAAVFEKLMQSGQTSQSEYMQRKQGQLSARLAKRKAELALDAIKTGKDPSKSANELELENATLALRAAEEALSLVEKQADAGQATGVERAAARRDAIKAKFQLDRLRLRQQQIQQQQAEQAAENEKAAAVETAGLREALAHRQAERMKAATIADATKVEERIVKTYPLKHLRATAALDMIKEKIDPKGVRSIQAGADERANIIIIVAPGDVHKLVAQQIDELDGTKEADLEAPKKEAAIRAIKKHSEAVRELDRRWNKADLQEWKTKLDDKNAEIDRGTLIRRLSLDLAGRLPTPEEVKEFLNDKEPDAVRRLTKRLLEGPTIAEKVKVWKKSDPATSKKQPPVNEDAQAAEVQGKVAKEQARIDIELLALDLQQSENQLAASQQKLAQTAQLVEQKAISQQEAIAAKIEVANCEIAVRRAKLKLEAAKLKYQSTEGAKEPAGDKYTPLRGT